MPRIIGSDYIAEMRAGLPNVEKDEDRKRLERVIQDAEVIDLASAAQDEAIDANTYWHNAGLLLYMKGAGEGVLAAIGMMIQEKAAPEDVIDMLETTITNAFQLGHDVGSGEVKIYECHCGPEKGEE